MKQADAATGSCFPEFMSLDIVQPLKIGESFSHYLMSHKVSGLFETDFAFDGQFSAGLIDLKIASKRGPPLGLFYNVYAILVATEKTVLAWHDFTAGCTAGNIPSVARGIPFDLPSIKNIEGDAINLRLMIWGR
jgi:hypothetical protein